MKKAQRSPIGDSLGNIADWLTKIVFGLMLVSLPAAFGALAARWPEASTEAWMSFTGSVIGAGLTVAASFGAIAWQSRRTDRQQRRFVQDTISEALHSLDALKAGSPSELERETLKPLDWHAKRIEGSLHWLERIMDWQPPDDLATLKAYDAIRHTAGEMRSNLTMAADDAQLNINAPMGAVTRAAISIAEKLREAHFLLGEPLFNSFRFVALSNMVSAPRRGA